jgi:cytochrome c oxidase assembly protein subunit 11
MTVGATSGSNRNNLRVGLYGLAGALFMLGMGFAAVPLYRIFCQVTGFGGTTQRADAGEAGSVKITDRPISVRFDSNIAPDLPWHFAPSQVTQEMKIGERRIAFYTSENLSKEPVTGVASFNVEPEGAGIYFKKIHCFCFNQQTLQPGQKVEMPVQYYVDPAILDDPDTKQIRQITLSYTFHKSADQSAAVASGGKGASKALDPASPAR